MLAERIRTLFELLQCSNTEIARFAGCSPSNISRLKSGLRDPGPSSRSVARLAEGVCRYADYENLLGVLGELCGSGEESASAMIPAVVSWLYEDQEFVLPQGMIPRSRQTEERTRLRFGEKLDRVMTLLDFSNVKPASAMSVDDSLISRYRGGIYCPRKNERIRESLSGLLVQRAEKEGKTGELAALMKVPEPEADAETLADWLFEAGKDHSFTLARALLESIEDFSSAGGGLLFASGEEGKEPDTGGGRRGRCRRIHR